MLGCRGNGRQYPRLARVQARWAACLACTFCAVSTGSRAPPHASCKGSVYLRAGLPRCAS